MWEDTHSRQIERESFWKVLQKGMLPFMQVPEPVSREYPDWQTVQNRASADEFGENSRQLSGGESTHFDPAFTKESRHWSQDEGEEGFKSKQFWVEGEEEMQAE